MKKKGEMQFVLRVDEKLIRRIDYIAEYYGRSRNSEIIWALKQYADLFEKNVDQIPDSSEASS